MWYSQVGGAARWSVSNTCSHNFEAYYHCPAWFLPCSTGRRCGSFLDRNSTYSLQCTFFESKTARHDALYATEAFSIPQLRRLSAKHSSASSMTITEHDNLAASALVQLSSPASLYAKEAVRSLPSPNATDDESMEDKPGGFGTDECCVRWTASGKRLPRATVMLDDQPEATEGDLQLRVGKNFLNLAETQKFLCFAGFRALTAITSPALLPWHIMCLSNLKVCTINVEVERCSHANFTIPASATIHDTDVGTCRVEKLIAQMPIEALQSSWPDRFICRYLPIVVNKTPNLRHLAQHLTRTAMHRACAVDVGYAYDFLLSGISSNSLETLIIDTCDIESAAVRHFPEDFFENISPLTSLHGFPNLRRIVAPQEAFIQVNSALSSPSSIQCVPPTILLPRSIESVDIIDSTTALTIWAEKLLDAYQASTGYRVSTLESLETITLWCDRWSPTLVPDYRIDA